MGGLSTGNRARTWAGISSILFSDIDSLMLYAGIHRQVLGFHRMLSRRFPWAVYYRFDAAGAVVVYRVLDCRQDPGKTRAALRKL